MTRLNQLPCPVLITDVDGLVLDSNNAFATLVGATAEQCLNKPMDELLAAASRVALRNRIWTLLRAASSIREERLEVVGQSGSPVLVLANAERRQLEGTECFYWVFFVAQELSRFEAKLLDARNRAEAAALELARRERFMAQRGRCFYTGIRFEVTSELRGMRRPSIDRRDSSKGYTRENVVLCLIAVNYAKNAWPEGEFLRLLDDIRTHSRALL